MADSLGEMQERGAEVIEADPEAEAAWVEHGIEVAYKAELAASSNPDQHLAEIKARLNQLRSPFRSAEFFEIEDIIEPADTRRHLCHWAELAYRALQPGSSRFGYRP